MHTAINNTPFHLCSTESTVVHVRNVDLRGWSVQAWAGTWTRRRCLLPHHHRLEQSVFDVVPLLLFLLSIRICVNAATTLSALLPGTFVLAAVRLNQCARAVLPVLRPVTLVNGAVGVLHLADSVSHIVAPLAGVDCSVAVPLHP